MRSRRRRIIGWIVLVAILVVAFSVRAMNALNPGPKQPIPFSHRVHVTSKKLNCFFCHTYATKSSNAGMPSVEKCLLCHSVIAPKFRPIAKIHAYYGRGESIPWVRVNRVPDFVHFSHQAHLSQEIDCGHCHGNVREMDRISEANVFRMSFCVDCHKERKVTVDCYTCHY